MRKLMILVMTAFVIMTGFNYGSSSYDSKDTVSLTKINNSVWIHTSYDIYEGVNTPSNGLVILTSKGAVLVDTPWTNPQTESLIRLIKKQFNKNVVLTIITHAHADRIGGIDTLLKHNILVESTKQTADLAVKNGYKSPKIALKNDMNMVIGKTKLNVFYPGQGHTTDNIIVWLPEYKILYGGCLVKAMASNSIGNISDANVMKWPNSIRRVMEKYKDIKYVVPGHGQVGGEELLKHTLEILKQNS